MKAVVLAIGVIILALPLAAQTRADLGDDDGLHVYHEYTPTRIKYDSVGGQRQAYYYYDGRWWDRWETDFPQAEQNFAKRLNELTSVVTAVVPLARELTHPELGNSPLIFMSDVGYMQLSRPEIEALRNYLANGGFLWVDDFWGDAEWASLERAMTEVLPGKTLDHASHRTPHLPHRLRYRGDASDSRPGLRPLGPRHHRAVV